MSKLIATALLAVCSLPLAAQQGSGTGTGSGSQNQGTRPDGAGGRLNFLAGYLSLTDAQKTQAQTIFTAAETASQTAQGQLASAREALQATVKANSPDAEIDRLAAALGVLQGQLLAIQTKASAKFYALLTTEQKAKYDQMGGGAGGGRMGPRGFGGFRSFNQ